ncbi:hypothetical protein, partial [Schaalia hyovaginalis]|uniref:hypothetical protein n=1 Tax=Schaalia hyovaginalis TaxID=29316 RepID=UPI001F3C0E77
MGLLFESLSSIASPGGVASHATRPRTLPGTVEKKRSRPRIRGRDRDRQPLGSGSVEGELAFLALALDADGDDLTGGDLP